MSAVSSESLGHESPMTDALARIDALAERLLERGIAPGYALAVTDRDGLLFVRQYGFANQDARTPIAPETLFEIGSIGKSFTAIVIMQLVKEGRIDLHAPVANYLPWFSVQSAHDAPITVHHLLTHTGGITGGSDHVPDPRYEVWSLRRTRTFAAPGECFLYSNMGYKALGLTLEALEGKPYAEIIGERILLPLGMTGAEAAITNEMRPRLAVGYSPRYLDRPWLPRHGVVPATWLETNTGDGCISTSATELAIYLRMLLNDGIGPNGAMLGPGQLETMLRPHGENAAQPNYGYALHLAAEDGGGASVERFGHSGGMVGYVSDMIADRTQGLGAVALCNGYGSPDELADFAIRTIAAARAGAELPELPVADPPLTQIDQAAEYAGCYRDPARGSVWTFVEEDGGLTLEATVDGEDTRIPMLRWPGRRGIGAGLMIADHPAFDRLPFEFVRAEVPAGEDEHPPVVEVFHGGDWFVNDRYEGPTAFSYPEAWDAYPGHYLSHNPWPQGMRVVLRKGKLHLIHGIGGGATELVPDGEGFRIGAEKPNPDWLAFDVVLDGQALVARSENGEEYARFFTP